MPVYKKRDNKVSFETHVSSIESIIAEIKKEEAIGNLVDVVIRVKKYIN